MGLNLRRLWGRKGEFIGSGIRNVEQNFRTATPAQNKMVLTIAPSG